MLPVKTVVLTCFITFSRLLALFLAVIYFYQQEFWKYMLEFKFRQVYFCFIKLLEKIDLHFVSKDFEE